MLNNLQKKQNTQRMLDALVVLGLVELIFSVCEKEGALVPKLIQDLGKGASRYIDNQRFKEDNFYTYISFYIKNSVTNT